MVKRRPAIVISPRLPYRDGLCSVVPLSTQAPTRELAYVVELQLAHPLPVPFDAETMWAKCDMLATVSLTRLDLFRSGRDVNGRRKYIQPKLPIQDFESIKAAIRAGLGI